MLTAEKAASHAAWPGARRGAAGGIDGAAARVPEDWLIEHGSGSSDESSSDESSNESDGDGDESSSESDGDGDESSSESHGDGDGGAGPRTVSGIRRTVSDDRDSYARRMADGAAFADDY